MRTKESLSPNYRSIVHVLLDIRYIVQPSDGRQNGQVNADYSMLVMTGGTGTIIMDGSEFHLERGRCFIVKPGTAFITVSEAKRGLSYYQFLFKIWDLHRTDECEQINGSQFFYEGEISCRPFSQCIEIVEAIYRNRHTKEELEAFYNHVRFQELLRFLFQQNRSDQSSLLKRQAVENSIEHIQQHYQMPWTVEQLADLADVARWHYTRIFKEITGQIPLDYLNGVRIDRASQLLLTTDDRLFDIAQHVGFNNEYYFNRRFKQKLGITPGQYRRHHRNHTRVFAPFLEDFVVALGITPVVQCSHSKWGKQDYLGLHHVPVIDLAADDVDTLSRYKPDFIMLDKGMDKWMSYDQLGMLAPTYHINHPEEDWRMTLQRTAELLGKSGMVQEIITQYEQKAHAAKQALMRSVRGQTVAFLRISALGISLYSGPDHGYTGPVLYKDLGLAPHPLVGELTKNIRKIVLEGEWLERLDADHLFITFDKRHSITEGEERKILQSQSWLELPAVMNGFVYEVDFLTWMNYGILSHGKKIDDVMKVLA
ncbi:AraC family transcriptional regulator [Paenibacillus spongiae]|uniref:AraC family transcriptional regulator n=1 Tax=Paenibacillus spongiae TaxID=2909671 RepID=A0ABY5S0S7_9BACL|nr:AraC family transcriptional regulator [Paenibacillus spongiae]UVI27451.1 AraC family transcriptional regulator [Paenibacillus spongiae]